MACWRVLDVPSDDRRCVLSEHIDRINALMKHAVAVALAKPPETDEDRRERMEKARYDNPQPRRLMPEELDLRDPCND